MSNWQQMMPTPEAYWLDKVLFHLHHRKGDLDKYKADADEYLEQYPLTQAMKNKITSNDVAGLYLSGVNPYILRAHCIGVQIPEAVSLAALRSLRKDQPNG